MKDYYEYDKENQELQHKINILKKEERLAKLKQEFKELNVLYKEVTDHVSTIKENMKFINNEMHNVSERLKYDNKIPMKEEDAETVKDILKTINVSTSKLEDINVSYEYLNKIKGSDIVSNASNIVDHYERSYKNKKKLVDNIEKFVKEDLKNNNQQSPVLENESICTVTSETMVFTELQTRATSSPFPSVRL